MIILIQKQVTSGDGCTTFIVENRIKKKQKKRSFYTLRCLYIAADYIINIFITKDEEELKSLVDLYSAQDRIKLQCYQVKNLTAHNE